MARLDWTKETTAIVHGYLLVNAPVGDYQGLDRSPFYYIGDLSYEDKLPPELAEIYKAVSKYRTSEFWGDLFDSLDPCLKLLDFARKEGPTLEVVAVYSPYLQSIGHSTVREPAATFLGFDVFEVGGWSLFAELENKVTRKPSSIQVLLNEAGLLREQRDLESVVEIYRQLAALDVVEPAEDGKDLPIEAVSVFSVDVERCG